MHSDGWHAGEAHFAGLRGPGLDADAVRRAFLQAGATMVQCVSPRCVFGERHLLAAHAHLERRRRAGSMRARDGGMELLLCLACTDQIEAAIDRAGMRGGEEAAVVAWEGEVDASRVLAGLCLARDDGLISPDGKSLSVLGMPKPPDYRPEDWAVELVNLAQL